MKLYLNGQASSKTNLLPYSDALIRGDGLFETILTSDQNAIAIDRHLLRMEKSAAQLRITMPNQVDIRNGVSKILLGQKGLGKMRLVVLSDGNWFISLEQLAAGLDQLKLTKIAWPINSKSILSGTKSSSYGQSLFAIRWAQSLGFDDGVFVNESGFVAESAFSNILILNDSKWSTPSLSTGCLPGIVRELLIDWFNVAEVEMTYQQLLDSQAIYLTSSLRLIQRVSRLDHKVFEQNHLGNQLITQFTDRLFSNIKP
jgi:branched-subunit amino acid aminotransferase/4-amino-4-deoxychorismate lyase